MVEVKALHSFNHGGRSYKRNQVWVETPTQADALRRAGLVSCRSSEPDPPKGTGENSSALPAAPVSPKRTSSKSGTGVRKKKPAASSSPTPPSV